MKNNVKTILFDFDGVIVDSFQPAFEVSRMLRPWFEIYIPKLFQLPAIKGIPKILKMLSKKYRLIIISSTISSPISEWLNRRGLAKYFSEIMGSDVHKVKLEKIRMIFEKYGINSNDCVFVTDTLGDLREAKKAGLNCLAVTYGFHGEDTLRKGKPAGFIKTSQDILIEVEKYWNKYKRKSKKQK